MIALLERVLALLLRDPVVREDVLGGLRHDHARRRRERGWAAADLWYLRQAVGVGGRAAFSRLARRRPRPVRRAEGWTMGTGGGGMDPHGLLMDLRLAARGLAKSPGLLAVGVVTIALGVGANTAVFSVVNAVLLAPLPYPEADRLVTVWPEKRWSVEMRREVAEGVDAFEGLAVHRSQSLTLLAGAVPEVLTGREVSPGYLETLGVAPALGRAFREGDAVGAEGPVVIISAGLWSRRFGADPSVVGRTVELSGNDAERRTVVGVMPAGFRDLDPDTEFWIPAMADPEAPGYFHGYGYQAVARLRPGVASGQAIPAMRALIDDMTPRHPTQFREARHSPVDVVPLLEGMIREVRPRLLVLLGAVGFVLLIACANVANLLLARRAARHREVGLQIALGAGRRRILRQVLTESALLGVAGGAAGLAAAWALLPLLAREVAEHLPRTELVGVDAAVLLFALAASLLSALVFGLVPALRSAGQPPGVVLAEAGRAGGPGRSHGRLNEALVVGEIALALVLLAGAGLMVESFRRLNRVEPGFETDGVLTLRLMLPAGRYDSAQAKDAFWREALARVGAVPGVRAVGTVSFLPLGGTSLSAPYVVEGQETPEGAAYQVVGYRAATAGYFAALGIPVLRGRGLTEDDAAGAEGAVLVNEAFVARHFAGRGALGERITYPEGEPIGTIVGVVPDVRAQSLGEEPMPEIITAAPQVGWNYTNFLVVRAEGDPASLRAAVPAALRELEPDLPVLDVRTMEEVVRESLGDSRFYTASGGRGCGPPSGRNGRRQRRWSAKVAASG